MNNVSVSVYAWDQEGFISPFISVKEGSRRIDTPLEVSKKGQEGLIYPLEVSKEGSRRIDIPFRSVKEGSRRIDAPLEVSKKGQEGFISPLEVSMEVNERHVKLLHIADDDTNPYCFIKGFGKLVGPQYSNANQKHISADSVYTDSQVILQLEVKHSIEERMKIWKRD